MRYGRTCEKGFLPVYSVDTEEEARMLLMLTCSTVKEGPQAGEFYADELGRAGLPASTPGCFFPVWPASFFPPPSSAGTSAHAPGTPPMFTQNSKTPSPC